MTPSDPSSARRDDRSQELESLETLWRLILRVQDVSHDASFFSLGGNSMLVIRMLATVSSRFGRDLDLDAFFSDPTLSTLHRLLAAQPSPDRSC